ncbi:MAG: nucleotidyltransferase domain-containing protein [Bacteroidetes bacterium]|nr:nucleotidyltransferase domain-containing protein [Gammaproteobacteria bacterium]MCY4204290.1 nucleotidyltransferase domain-containing protein [Bacteroidota bacterium]
MHDAIADKREMLVELCRLHGVTRLEIFGSGARGVDFDPETSDVDFLVEFCHQDENRTLGQYFDFRNALSLAVGYPVDLVEAGAIRNPYLRVAINKSRELIYAS